MKMIILNISFEMSTPPSPVRSIFWLLSITERTRNRDQKNQEIHDHEK